MTGKEILAWIFGLGAMIALFSIYQQKERRRLILSKLCADVCWIIHYLCLGAYGGMIPNVVGFFRELTFIQRDKKRWASSIFLPIIFILINLGLGITTFKEPINILPICASTFATISLWLRRPRLTKLVSMPASLAFLVYDCFVGSYIGIVNESIAIFSIILYFLREKGGKTNG